MTSLSFMLSARRWMNRAGRIAPFLPPVWPVVAIALAVWGVAFCSGADAPPAPVNWVGASRAEVVAGLGKPMSALQRGDTEVLMYADNVRIEIRSDEVVSYRSGNQAVLVKSDGTRYAASDRGKVSRLDPVPEEPVAGNIEPVRTRAAPAAMAPVAGSGEVADNETAAEDETELAAEPTVEEQYRDISDAIEKLGQDQKKAMGPYRDPLEDDEEDEAYEEPPAWVGAVGTVVLGLFRFGFAVLVLRLAINFVDLPCYMPDVLKVAALFVVIREGVHGLGGLGGHWEWLRLFRAADVVSFFALCGLLVRFKVATQGITALKIAIATEVATYFVMMMIGIAIIFAFGAFL